jgi:hypothetical protein
MKMILFRPINVLGCLAFSTTFTALALFILVELIPLHFSQVFSVLREYDAESDLSKEAPGTSSSLSSQ